MRFRFNGRHKPAEQERCAKCSRQLCCNERRRIGGPYTEGICYGTRQGYGGIGEGGRCSEPIRSSNVPADGKRHSSRPTTRASPITAINPKVAMMEEMYLVLRPRGVDPRAVPDLHWRAGCVVRTHSALWHGTESKWRENRAIWRCEWHLWNPSGLVCPMQSPLQL